MLLLLLLLLLLSLSLLLLSLSLLLLLLVVVVVVVVMVVVVVVLLLVPDVWYHGRYSEVSVVFNHKNLWVNMQWRQMKEGSVAVMNRDPALITYNMFVLCSRARGGVGRRLCVCLSVLPVRLCVCACLSLLPACRGVVTPPTYPCPRNDIGLRCWWCRCASCSCSSS